ncbi:amino acid transporter [Penicillium brasilianum]|uniref:Amino acid transporter n=1 Tax=Penicillium brasilianum TaxID=104259 RepID=A0A1S9RLN8_PENBI|nr:amino acid transporter [Penicillium brasilianum]
MDPPNTCMTGIADYELGLPIDKAAATPTPCIAKLDPFGDESDAGLKYKTMTWWQAGMVMIAETISLGILALPKALATLGLIPGVFTILAVGIISIYTGFTIGTLKSKYMQIHSMADAGGLLMGRAGQLVLGIAQLVFYIFVMGSHVLTFSIMMNVLTNHGSCTLLYSALGLLVSFILTLPRRLEKLSHLSSVSFVSIVMAILVTMISIVISKGSPASIPLISPAPAMHEACLAFANIVFAYAGHVAFFTMFSELQEIKDYPRALTMLHLCEMILYTITAIVIYAYAGPLVKSPALNSAEDLFRKISFGLAIPTIVIGGVVNAHLGAKYMYVHIFRGSKAIHAQTCTARASWVAICVVMWILSWIIAEVIPVFNDVLGLASSLFASWFTFGLPGMFWLFLNRHRWFMTRNQMLFSCINIGLVFLALIICLIGVYSSAQSIFHNLRDGARPGIFSCADNSLY